MATTRDGLISVRTGRGPMKRWSKRLLVLTQRQLIVYGSSSAPLVHDVVDLTTIVSCVLADDAPSELEFDVSFGADPVKLRVLRFLSGSVQSCKEWVEAINQGIVPRRRSVEATTTQHRPTSNKKRLSLPVIVTEFGAQQINRTRMLHYQQSMSFVAPLLLASSPVSTAATTPPLTDPHRKHIRLRSSVSSIDETDNPSAFRQKLLRIVHDIGGLEAQLLVQLLGTDRLILTRLLELANQARPDSNTIADNVQGEIRSILKYVLRDPRFESAVESVPDENDPVMSALAVQLKWLLVKGKAGARDKFSSFLKQHLYGDRFNEQVAEAVMLCLKGPKTQRFPKLLRYPQIWKGLLLATVYAPLIVKNNVFRELTWLLLDDPTNAQTLILQPEWLEWILQPIVFDQTNQSMRDEHMHLRIHLVVLVHFDMMFTSGHFGDLLKMTMSQFRRLNESNRATAAVFLECLVSKVNKQKHRFSILHDDQHVESLMHLTDVITTFTFCAADWRKTDIGTGKGDLMPPEYWDYRAALLSPQSNRIGYDEDAIDITESMLGLLIALGFAHEDDTALTQGDKSQKERSIHQRFIAARDMFRDSLLLLNVLASRGSSLSMESHIRPQIRQFLQTPSSSKRIEICAKDVVVPQGENPSPDLQRLLQFLVHRNVSSSLTLESMVAMVRSQLKSEFTSSALVDVLGQLQIAPRLILAQSILIVLIMSNLVHPLNWKSMTTPIAPYQLYRFSSPTELSVVDLKSSLDDLSSSSSKILSMTEDTAVRI